MRTSRREAEAWRVGESTRPPAQNGGRYNLEPLRYRLVKGKVRFAEHVKEQHRRLRKGVLAYVIHGRPLSILTAPVIYVVIVPFLLLDAMVGLFQLVCFPVYGIPRVRRSDYLILDRRHLAYLNGIEKLNCLYCSYTNGLLAFVEEVAGRTEQHWCPIRHARPVPAPHSRYARFLDYGDAESYRGRSEEVRRDFEDVKSGADSPTAE